MNVTEKYIKERNLQKLAVFVFLAAGTVAILFFPNYWGRVIFSTAMSSFGFMLLHTVYLGLKYSQIHSTKGIYSKYDQPIFYWSFLIILSLAGFYSIYRAING